MKNKKEQKKIFVEKCHNFSNKELIDKFSGQLMKYHVANPQNKDVRTLAIQTMEGELLLRLEKKTDEKICPTCGQTTKTKSSLNKAMAHEMIIIGKFIKQKGINVFHPTKELVDGGLMNFNQRTNMVHISNNGLVAPLKGEPGNWVLTRKGMNFLKGEKIPKVAIVDKSTKITIDHEGETDIHQLLKGGGYWEQPGFDIVDGKVINVINGHQAFNI